MGKNEVDAVVGWEDFNLNLMEGVDFEVKTRNLILPVFDNATNALEEGWKEYEKTFKKQICEAYQRDEAEGSIMSQEKDWEEDLHSQRLQGVGALALDWLMSSVQVALRGAKTYLDKTHPACPPYRKEEGWLGHAQDEYQKRFGIDFTSGPVPFERMQELVLARNAGIHREDEGTLKTYVARIKKPAFMQDDYVGDHFFVSRDALISIMEDSERFIKWAISRVEKLRPLKKRES